MKISTLNVLLIMQLRNAIENKGLRVSRNTTEYLLPSSCHDKVKHGGEEIKNVTTFKYLGSMFDTEGGTTTDCKNRIRLAWNKWREVTGVICDKKVPVKLKQKIYTTVTIPTMTYGAERWTMKKKDEMLTNKTEMRMLRWIQGVSQREHKINEEIWAAATVQPIATHLMQKRPRWYGHVRRRHESHTTRTVLDMVVEGVRPRGRPKLQYMDTIRRDIKKNALTDVNILDRKDWRLAVSRATDWSGRAFKVSRWECFPNKKNQHLQGLPRYHFNLANSWIRCIYTCSMP